MEKPLFDIQKQINWHLIELSNSLGHFLTNLTLEQSNPKTDFTFWCFYFLPVNYQR